MFYGMDIVYVCVISIVLYVFLKYFHNTFLEVCNQLLSYN